MLAPSRKPSSMNSRATRAASIDPAKTPGTRARSKPSGSIGELINAIRVSADGPVKLTLLTAMGVNACCDSAYVSTQPAVTARPTPSADADAATPTLFLSASQAPNVSQVAPAIAPAGAPACSSARILREV